MATNAIVQHNGGFLSGVILLTQCYYHRGTRLNAMKRFCICSLELCSHLNVLTLSPLTGGCSEGLDAFRYMHDVTCCTDPIPWDLDGRPRIFRRKTDRFVGDKTQVSSAAPACFPVWPNN